MPLGSPKLQLDAVRDDLRRTSPQTIAAEAERRRRQGHWAAAVALFEDCLAQAPHYAWAWAHHGEALREGHRFEEAVAAFSRALSLQPDYPWAKAHRGAAYYYLRRYDDALRDLNQVIDAQPDYVWALAYRPHVTIALKRYAEALADVDAFLALDPSLLPHQEGERGMLLNYLGRYDAAAALCEVGLAKDSDDFIAAYTRTVALAESRGRQHAPIQDTRDLLQRCRREHRGDAGLIAYRLAGLAALEGRREEALQSLATAILLHHEPIETARHDPVWRTFHQDPDYRALIARAEV